LFIAIYEFDVNEGLAEQFREHWFKTTEGICRLRGSLGSRLHSTNKPHIFVAYAQRQSREHWQDSRLTDEEYLAARSDMRKCLNSSKTVYELEVIEDRFVSITGSATQPDAAPKLPSAPAVQEPQDNMNTEPESEAPVDSGAR